MKCIKCDREDFISLGRNRQLVEFRLLKTKGHSGGGDYTFKSKQWQKESDRLDKGYYLRCNACEHKYNEKELAEMGIEEIIYKGKSEVTLVSNAYDKFWGDGKK